MPVHLAFALKVFATPFAIMNPISKIPIFLGLTEGVSVELRRRVATIALVGTTICCLVAMAAAEAILDFFGIAVDVQSGKLRGSLGGPPPLGVVSANEKETRTAREGGRPKPAEL